MTTVIVNAVSCRSGGGLNDLVQTLPRLRTALDRAGISTRTFVVDQGERALSAAGINLNDVVTVDATSPRKRMAWELHGLAAETRRLEAGAVLQFSNFLFRSLRGVPQIVVLRSRTFSSTAYRSLPRRGLYQTLRYRGGRRLTRFSLRAADAIFCISEVQRTDFIDAFGEAAERIQVIHPGINVPESWRAENRRQCPAAPVEEGERSVAETAAPSSRRTILNIAHYYEHKNLITLLRAIDALAARRSDILLVLTAGIAQYRGARTQQVAEEQSLAEKLTTAGLLRDLGPISQDQVWPQLARADVFAFPSITESFGHPLAEAMAVGVPVIASDTPIHREVCGDSALYFPTLDSGKLADILDSVLNTPDLRRRLVACGSTLVARFSWDRHADAIAAALAGLAGNETTGKLSEPDPHQAGPPYVLRSGQ
jgi:glycosyltransferase involved in cell wall biosynthesis